MIRMRKVFIRHDMNSTNKELKKREMRIKYNWFSKLSSGKSTSNKQWFSSALMRMSESTNYFYSTRLQLVPFDTLTIFCPFHLQTVVEAFGGQCSSKRLFTWTIVSNTAWTWVESNSGEAVHICVMSFEFTIQMWRVYLDLHNRVVSNFEPELHYLHFNEKFSVNLLFIFTYYKKILIVVYWQPSYYIFECTTASRRHSPKRN